MGVREGDLPVKGLVTGEQLQQVEEQMGRMKLSVHAMAFENRERGGRGGKGKMMALADIERVSGRMQRLEDWAIECGYHLMPR